MSGREHIPMTKSICDHTMSPSLVSDKTTNKFSEIPNSMKSKRTVNPMKRSIAVKYTKSNTQLTSFRKLVLISRLLMGKSSYLMTTFLGWSS